MYIEEDDWNIVVLLYGAVTGQAKEDRQLIPLQRKSVASLLVLHDKNVPVIFFYKSRCVIHYSCSNTLQLSLVYSLRVKIQRPLPIKVKGWTLSNQHLSL